MFKVNKNIVLALVLPLVVATGCKRDDGIVGPEYKTATDSFALTSDFQVADEDVDFSNEVETFTATFNEEVSWKVTLTGMTSGAKKIVSGFSDELNASNALWTGGHDEVNFFMEEDVVAELTLLGSPLSFKDTLTISTTKDFSADANVVLVTGSDFESGAEIGFPSQFSFDAPIREIVLDNSAVQGKRFFRLAGKSAQPDGFFVGGIQHRKAGFHAPAFTNPDSVWVNIYVKGAGLGTFGRIDYQFLEDDGNDANGAHDPAHDDGWVFSIPTDFVGWKLFSAKYSTLVPSESAENGGSGNRVKEPGRINWVQAGLLSDPAKNTVEGSIDYLTITFGGPFDPSK